MEERLGALLWSIFAVFWSTPFWFWLFDRIHLEKYLDNFDEK